MQQQRRLKLAKSSFYREADALRLPLRRASNRARVVNLLLSLALLVAGIAAALAGQAAAQAIVTAVSIGVSMFPPLDGLLRRRARRAFAQTALAQSIKRAEIRYVMISATSSSAAAESELVSAVSDAVETFGAKLGGRTLRALRHAVASYAPDQAMRAQRTAALQHRIRVYVADRVNDQLDYFRGRRATDRHRSKTEVALTWTLGAAAVITACSAVIGTVVPKSAVFGAPELALLLAGAAAAIFALRDQMFLRSDRETLAELWAQELAELEEIPAPDATTEAEFARYVERVEEMLERWQQHWRFMRGLPVRSRPSPPTR